ncbi:MAG: glycosyltransferase family 2 protein [Oscillospiraceae bacterium]|jgi:glycosyltransferase involved in cell wall biosynthesis|nr:glycosyltransferase family 2 protein [Oscillospiraceae bacterium]
MKTISIIIPTYNEEENVLPIYDALREQLAALEGRYGYEILFIDNKSLDGTRDKILQLCARDERVKAIFNTRNFGASNSSYYGALQTTGDCTIGMCADFQDPPELLPRMVEAWEQGHKIVAMVKTHSRENPLVRVLRTAYYRSLRRLSGLEMIEHFTSFALYDKSALDVGRGWDDPEPFPRGMVAEYGLGIVTIPYTQPKRRAGKTSNHFFSLYDYAMLGVTRYTKLGARLATFLGLLVSGISFVAALVCLFVHREALPTLGLFCLGGIQMFFLGLLGEYVISIQRRSMKRPLVFEERRVNFD